MLTRSYRDLFFSCIRSRRGWNNNPDCLQFMWTIRRLLFLNNVTASLNANCINDDTAIPAILKCNKKNNVKSDAFDFIDYKAIEQIVEAIDKIEVSLLQRNVLFYITGCIVKNLCKVIKCNDCINILINNDINNEHNYYIQSSSEASFIKFINRGKLCIPSSAVYKIVLFAEKAFKAELNVYSINTKNFTSNILRATLQHFTPLITSILTPPHPVIDTCGNEDLHDSQLIKAITLAYCFIRVSTFTKKMIQRSLGHLITTRSKLHKTILFYNI